MNHREYYNLYMDFDTLRDNGIFPSDIDLIYKCRDDYLIIGEIKYQGNKVKGKQEEVLTSIINNYSKGGILLEIEHSSRVQDGAETVDVADCLVRRAFFDGKWHTYQNPLMLLKWMTGLSYKHGGMYDIRKSNRIL